MAAPKGNKFWQLRSKHGRDKLFTSPELLWEAACEYFEWCDENPLMAVEYNGKDAKRCEVPKMRAYTLMGLCSYLGCVTNYVQQFEADQKKSEKPEAKGFIEVLTRIRETIYNQKFEGAAAGFLNHNIIVRDLALREAKDVNQTINVKELPDWLK